MLSLKSSRLQPSLLPKKCLTDLPNEILDTILHHVYHDSGGYISSIFAVSRTCQYMRAATYPLLFETVTIKVNEDIIVKQSWDLLEHLISHPHHTRHIRCLQIQTAVEPRYLPSEANLRSARMGQGMSRKRLLGCLRMMTSLRMLKLFYLSDMNFEVLEQLQPSNWMEVSLDLSETELCFDSKSIEKLLKYFSASPSWSWSISLPRAKYTQAAHGLASLIASGNVSTINWCDNSSALKALVSARCDLPHLTEFHVSSKTFDVQDYLLTPGFIPWLSLRRLHVEGDRQIRNLLSTTVDKLINLHALSLQASTTDAFHDDCPNNARAISPIPLPYTLLPNLQHLSLRGICSHIPLRYLTTPTLKTLIVILPEYHARLRSLNEVRSPSELKWLATNLPNLEHLETHIGSLENLWHPTAIPGVEVNVEVYTALQAISQIRHLRTLRLFPPYVPKTPGHDYLNARQPLPDEQAIRVFQHLHAQRPSLNTLSIAATFYALRGFSPMSWLVRDGGNGKTMLTTHQAGKDYELLQIWVGERRMRMENRRHSYRRPYLRELNGGSWIFPIEDPPV